MSTDQTPAIDELWATHRRRVLDIGYRMLGSVTEAEDVAQDAFERLVATDLDAVDDPLGWLVAVTSRLCVDRLRRHERTRRAYTGPWLPEPVLGGDSVAETVTLDDSVRMALLVVLESLTPAERTAFVLHDVFALPFDEIGGIVGRSPTACRQLASRARRRVRAEAALPRAEPPTDPAEHRRLVERFAAACRRGDLDGLVAVLAPDVVGDFDSGGVIAGAPLEALRGAHPVGRSLLASLRRLGGDILVRDVNGDPGLVVVDGDRVLVTISAAINDGRVAQLHGVGNPAKLAHLQPWGDTAGR